MRLLQRLAIDAERRGVALDGTSEVEEVRAQLGVAILQLRDQIASCHARSGRNGQTS